MSRPSRLFIDSNALMHNLEQIRHLAPGKKVIAMVKANAYGCGVRAVAPVLDGHVEAFGVACLEEALVLHTLGVRTHCILFQGVFCADEYKMVAHHQLGCVIHQPHQLHWLLNTPLNRPVKVWVKWNTGMHRLGFKHHELQGVMDALQHCTWVDKEIGLFSHLACADEPERVENAQQIALFEGISISGFTQRSMSNSAGIISFPHIHADAVRPGIMLYGVSPLDGHTSHDLGLKPVMRLISEISAIHNNPPFAKVGYSGTWSSEKPSTIGIIPIGYGDGYPRHIAVNTPVWVLNREVPIVGRVSMDMLAVDLTDHPDAQIGTAVELWGKNILVERIAQSAGTSAYELLCQVSDRLRQKQN